MYMDPNNYGLGYQMYGGAFYDQEYSQNSPFYKEYEKKQPSPMAHTSSNLFYTQGNVDWSYNETSPSTGFSGSYQHKYYPQGKSSIFTDQGMAKVTRIFCEIKSWR
jgi:hypothetical protein